jgi:lysozyme
MTSQFESLIASLSKPFPIQEPKKIELSKAGARKVNQETFDLILKFEKLHRVGSDGLIYPYHDMLGYPTIGIGHLLSKVKFEDLSKYPPITREEAFALKQVDLDKFSFGVSRLFPIPLSDNEFGALVSLAFNIGLGNIQASTLRRKMNRGDSREECSDEFLKFDKAGGHKVRGLTRRRIAERELFLS